MVERPPPGSPDIEVREDADGVVTALVHGDWHLRAVVPRLRRLRERLAESRERCARWDLRALGALDSAGALLLWDAWGRRFPEELRVRPEHRRLFDSRVSGEELAGEPRRSRLAALTAWAAEISASALDHLRDALVELGEVVFAAGRLVKHPGRIPWRETSSTIYFAGVTALSITGLIGLLIGVVIAYQSALQLEEYGGEIYIVDILGFSITRELGPILAAILVAGRSGSSMTAQLGVMRLTEELDAMTVLGISVTERIVLPRVVGLTIALPLLTIWTDFLAMIGGMMAADLALGVSLTQFMVALPDSLPVVNLWIGLGKAAVFGALIGMTAAHYGLRVQPNTLSLAAETTKAVVAAITLVVALDGGFSVVFQDVGF